MSLKSFENPKNDWGWVQEVLANEFRSQKNIKLLLILYFLF